MDIQIIWYLININLWKSWTSICICDLDVHVGKACLFVYQWFLVMSITHRHLIFHTSNYWVCKCSTQNYWFNQNYEKYIPLLGIITRISFYQMFAFKTIFRGTLKFLDFVSLLNVHYIYEKKFLIKSLRYIWWWICLTPASLITLCKVTHYTSGRSYTGTTSALLWI